MLLRERKHLLQDRSRLEYCLEVLEEEARVSQGSRCDPCQSPETAKAVGFGPINTDI